MMGLGIRGKYIRGQFGNRQKRVGDSAIWKCMCHSLIDAHALTHATMYHCM